MAKIEWVFQDESGTNLNRYIATNVDTGEKITFDLLRGAIIPQGQEGTPLNAETLNSLITAINSNFDEITTLKQSVATNASNIATNTKSILVLDTRTTTMGEVVKTNTASIQSNASAISKFTTKVNNMGNAVSANAKAISNIEGGTTTVKKAEQDSDGNNIVSTYATKDELTDGSLQVGAIQDQCELGSSGLYLDDVFDLENGMVNNSNLSQLSLNLQTYKLDVNASSESIATAGLYSIKFKYSTESPMTCLFSVEDIRENCYSAIPITTASYLAISYSASTKTISLNNNYKIVTIRLITEYTYGV